MEWVAAWADDTHETCCGTFVGDDYSVAVIRVTSSAALSATASSSFTSPIVKLRVAYRASRRGHRVPKCGINYEMVEFDNKKTWNERQCVCVVRSNFHRARRHRCVNVVCMQLGIIIYLLIYLLTYVLTLSSIGDDSIYRTPSTKCRLITGSWSFNALLSRDDVGVLRSLLIVKHATQRED